MKPPPAPLAETYTTKLDASGNGSISFGPNRQRQRWVPPLTIGVTTSGTVNEPVAQVFQGSVSVGSTYTGNQDSTDLPAVTLYAGQTLRVVWTGGDAGAIATASVTGTVDWW